MAARRFTPAQHQAMAEMREAGVADAGIALAFGCTVSAVEWACLKLGADGPRTRALEPRAWGPEVVPCADRTLRRYSAEEDALILALALRGVSASETGRRLGRRHNSIRARLMTLARHDARAEAA